MAETPLSQREFDTWREDDREFKGEMRQFVAAQVSVNLTNERRISTIEEKQKSNDRKVVALTTVISSAVTSALAYVFNR